MQQSQETAILEYLSAFITERRRQKMLEVLNRRTRHLCVVLENIYQTQNASAVLRSCECFGIQDVHVIENQNPFDIHPDIALGADKWLSIHAHTGPGSASALCLNSLKQKGYRIVATSPHRDDCSLEQLDISQPLALVFGTELRGLSQEATALADAYLRIPMVGFTESFNISVAAGISLFHLSGRIRKEVPDWGLTQEEKQTLLLKWIKNSLKNPEQLIRHYLQSQTK